MMGKKIYCGILFAGGLGFCQTGYSAALQCKPYTINVKNGDGVVISTAIGQMCYETGGSGWVPPPSEPQSSFIAEGSGIPNPQYGADQRYLKSQVDPDGDGMMNCYKNLTESSQDNYHMDDGDRFVPRRKHPVTGVWKEHKGIDLQAKQGTPVYSMSFGRVSQVGLKDFYNGNYVRVKWWNGPFEYEATYIHLAEGSIIVQEGQTVFPGSPIGGVGSTGQSNGPHLHLQLKRAENMYSTRGKFPVLIASEEELLDPLLFLGSDSCNKL